MTTDQIEATQGLRVAGKHRNTSRSRLNRLAHGLLSCGITPLDDADSYFALLNQLRQELEPEGEIEGFLVQRIALAMIRVKRASRLEAEAIAGALFPERRSRSKLDQEMEQQFDKMGFNTSIVEPGFNPQLGGESVAILAEGLARYETGHERRLFKTMQELERVQRARKTARSALPSGVSEKTTPQIPLSHSLRMEKSSNVNSPSPGVDNLGAVTEGHVQDS